MSERKGLKYDEDEQGILFDAWQILNHRDASQELLDALTEEIAEGTVYSEEELRVWSRTTQGGI